MPTCRRARAANWSWARRWIPQELHATRSTLDFAEGLAVHMLDLFPFLSEVKVLRQWAGMADMTPDFSPIMGVTPCEGFYLDAGWGTWGFKATPISRQDHEPHRGHGCESPADHGLHAGAFRASSRSRARRARRRWGTDGGRMKLLRCPLNGERPAARIRLRRRSARDCRPCATAAMTEWTAYLLNRNSVPRVKREWWCHTPSGYWFIAERDTARDEFLRT